MNPKEYCSLVSVLFAVFIPAIVARSSSIDQTSDLIEGTCHKTPYPEFCTSRILSDKRSSTAKGPADLGIIMLDQAGYNAQSAITKITALLKQGIDPFIREPLSNCKEVYTSTVNGWVPFSKDAFNKNEPRLAYQYMSNAAVAAVRCEDDLKWLGPSPLTDWNNFANMAASVSSAIAESLL